jgi:hypothetical protein
MAEQYPSDAVLEALAGTADAAAAVEYPAEDTDPWLIAANKLTYRLLDVARRAGDLRVYKDGDLTFGVRAGRWYDGTTARAYAGATDQALTDDATNYIYLTAAGVLTVATSGFPDPADTAFIPLAEILAADGAYDFADITDYRGAAMFRPAGPTSRDMLAAETATLAIPPAAFRATADGDALPLATQTSGGDLGFVAGTHGAGGPVLGGSASTDSQTYAARVQAGLPPQYVAGGDISLVVRVIVDSAPQVAATLDASVVAVADGEAGGDLYAGAAAAIGEAWANATFAIDPTGLVAGDTLDIVLTVAIDDTGGAGTSVVSIGGVTLEIEAKG